MDLCVTGFSCSECSMCFFLFLTSVWWVYVDSYFGDGVAHMCEGSKSLCKNNGNQGNYLKTG